MITQRFWCKVSTRFLADALHGAMVRSEIIAPRQPLDTPSSGASMVAKFHLLVVIAKTTPCTLLNSRYSGSFQNTPCIPLDAGLSRMWALMLGNPITITNGGSYESFATATGWCPIRLIWLATARIARA